MFHLDVSQWVNDTTRKLQALQNSPAIELGDLFPPAFMATHTTVPDLESFARESGVDFSGGWDTVDADALEAAVRRLTTFENWQAMKEAGLAAWFNRQ